MATAPNPPASIPKFLAQLSHELRTPLTGLLGSISLLADTNLTYDQYDLLDCAKICGDQMLFLINNVLDWTRLEEREINIESSWFPVKQIVEEALEIVSTQGAAKMLDLVLEDKLKQITFKGDAPKLRQVLINLLSNAIKFSEKGTISLYISSEPLQESSCEFKISVSDEGVGIPEEIQPRIFEPFVQAGGNKQAGSGLGLSISKKLVEAMGGQIWFQSQMEKGTTFFLRFITERDPCELVSSHMDLQHVLIIDNNPALKEFLCDELKKMNLTPIVTSSLEEAMPLIKSVELVMLDCSQYPNSVVQHIYQQKPTVNVSYRRLPNLPSDATMFLKKPVRERPLQDLLSKFFTGKTAEPCPRGYNPARNQEECSILVAEDNLFNQKIIQRLLLKAGFSNFFVVSDGQQAVEYARKQRVHVVLMDVTMPLMSGIEATKAILAESESSERIPIIIGMTADAFADTRENCLKVGMKDILLKPIDVNALTSILYRYCHK